MEYCICCVCGLLVKNTISTKRTTRWWRVGGVIRCLAALTLLTVPSCCGIEDNPVSDSSQQATFWAEVNMTYIDPQTDKPVHMADKGKYGIKSLLEARSGLAVHVRNKDNKTHGCDDYAVKIPKEKWIAVVERGHCLFTDKIKMATKTYNASAVVIYDHEDNPAFTIMQHSVEDQVSIFVSKETGRRLGLLADQGIRVMLTITLGDRSIPRLDNSNNISKTSVLFVSISFIVLMIISLAWLVFYYIQRFRYAHAKERLARRLASAAKKAIAKIPQKTVRHGDKELDSEFDQCAVCIESYKPHEVIRILPCRHVFHKSCVDPWLLDQRSCPMCKLDILRAYGMQVFGSHESVHRDPESGNVHTVVVEPAPEHSSSSSTEEPVAADTEVKVLLLPHACLHFDPAHDPATSDPGACGLVTRDERHLPTSASSSVRNSGSGERLSRAAGARDSEMQALMSPGLHEEEEEDIDEGFDEHHPAPHLCPSLGDASKDEAGENVPVDRHSLALFRSSNNIVCKAANGNMSIDKC